MRRFLAAALAATAMLSSVSAAVAATANPTGPDVASFQHPYGASIAWNQVASPGGSSFTFIKATEGTGYVNPYFAADAARARAAGLLVGAYHFARPSTGSAVAQADYFVAHAGGRAALDEVGELPPTLDLEVNGGLGPAALVAWTQQWLTEVTRLTGRKPILYTFPNFWPDDMANSTAFGSYPLWIASYSGRPVVLPGWTTWTFWQYTDNATVAGISGRTDLDQFNGTLPQLRALALENTMPPGNNPVGSLDSVTASPGAVRVAGWTIDPNTARPIGVHVYVDHAGVRLGAAGYRPDVARVYPAAGSYHGFAGLVPATTGTHTVCVYAINVGAGTANPDLGCRTVTVPAAAPTAGSMPLGPSPVGALDAATAPVPGALRVQGWAVDPTTTGADRVTVSLNGSWVTNGAAGLPNATAAASYPGAGQNHGYDVTVAEPAGTYEVCVTATAFTVGAPDTQLGCRPVMVP